MNDIKRKILISCDDGFKEDIQLIELLLKYRIPAVFYIAPHYAELSADDIKKIANGGWCLKRKCGKLFEVGAHTMNHPEDLKRLSDKELVDEIEGSKKHLEAMIGKTITKFCYPSGRFDERAKKIVKDAGFKEARTTRVLNTDFPIDLFETNTSVHIHPDRKEYGDKSWIEVGYELFDKVIKEGGQFELWGHSWEVEKFHQWEFLEDFLSYMNDEMIKINYKREI